MTLPACPTLATGTPEPHVLLVTLNRPEVRNAINTQMEGIRAFNERRKPACRGR